MLRDGEKIKSSKRGGWGINMVFRQKYIPLAGLAFFS
jgi:hypothetical protein